MDKGRRYCRYQGRKDDEIISETGLVWKHLSISPCNNLAELVRPIDSRRVERRVTDAVDSISMRIAMKSLVGPDLI